MRARIWLVGSLLLTLLPGLALADGPEYSAEAGFYSNYTWRGIKLSPGWVFQPAGAVSYRGFYLQVWGNVNLEGDTGLNEIDLTAAYTFEFVPLSLEVGFIHYGIYDALDSDELYGTFSFNAFLNPEVSLYVDVNEGTGAYLVGSVGHSFGLPGGVSFDLRASAGYVIENGVMGLNDAGTEFNNFYNGELSFSATLPLGPHLTLEPLIAYGFPLSEDGKEAIRSVSWDGDSDFVYGGAKLTVTF